MMEPTERSTPPAMITMAWPTAMVATKEIARSTSIRLPALRNGGARIRSSAHSSRSTQRTPTSRGRARRCRTVLVALGVAISEMQSEK